MLIGAKIAKSGRKSCEQIVNFEIAGFDFGEMAIFERKFRRKM